MLRIRSSRCDWRLGLEISGRSWSGRFAIFPDHTSSAFVQIICTPSAGADSSASSTTWNYTCVQARASLPYARHRASDTPISASIVVGSKNCGRCFTRKESSASRTPEFNLSFDVEDCQMTNSIKAETRCAGIHVQALVLNHQGPHTLFATIVV